MSKALYELSKALKQKEKQVKNLRSEKLHRARMLTTRKESMQIKRLTKKIEAFAAHESVLVEEAKVSNTEKDNISREALKAVENLATRLEADKASYKRDLEQKFA